jgi:hypothetical protein
MRGRRGLGTLSLDFCQALSGGVCRDAEIAKRGTTKAAPAAVSVERFVAEIEGVALPDKVKDEIEKAIHKAVATELAKIDTRGDMVEAPLSKIANFGAGLGARIRGRYLVNKNLNLG